MVILLLATVLTSCRIGTSGDDSGLRAGECQPADEVPYDGIDQDCDGSDLTDVDGDGHNAPEVGGDDCDDEDAATYPGADEVPYDGVDQDCDGADITDVDDDGYDSNRVEGGTDCDDEDASVFPGAEESRGDGVDEDCDGYADEYVVCVDGTGDFATIQDGVDGVPDDSPIEICPGTYEEYVTITDRVLVIYGGGDHPNDVVVDGQATGASGFSISGDTADVTVTNLTIQGGADKSAVVVGRGATAVIDLIDFCGNGYIGSKTVVHADQDSNETETTVTRSQFCNQSGDWIKLDFEGAAIVSQNVFGTSVTDDGIAISMQSGSKLLFSNNLVTLGGAGLNFAADDPWSGETVAEVRNNTFADLVFLVFSSSLVCDEKLAKSPIPTVTLADNIFSHVDTDDYALWYVLASACEGYEQPYDLPTFQTNLLWDIVGDLIEINFRGSADTEPSSTFESASILVDPKFVTSPNQGDYALDSSSPAVDAGSGDDDADGTLNDLGAFGGPEGEWWQEVPWLP